VRPAVGVPTTFRRKTSPQPRAFRLAALFVVGEAGRRGGIVAERNPKTLRRPRGASSGLLAAEGGVDEFAKRRRTALEGLREHQNCYVFPRAAFVCARAAVGYNRDGPSFPYKQIGGKCSAPLKLDTFWATLSERRASVLARTATGPRTRPG